MDRCRLNHKTKRDNYTPRRSFSICGILCRAGLIKLHNHKSNNKYTINYRNYVSILTIISVILSPKVLANTSQTAAPVANSSGSVTNMAIQSLQGNLIQNQYGGNILCQGPMLTFSPFVTDSHQYSIPREYWYDAPQYDDDGNVTHHVATRTGQKDNHSLNLGFSMTFSIPLDQSLQRRCKQAADNQIKRTAQMLKDSELNWHIARLKNCGELKLQGIEFAPSSPYFKLCEDVLVKPRLGQVLPHRHNIPVTSSSSTVVNPSSSDKR